ncbi:hypothetical protein HID58_058110 [Brassica napus]|uniref:Uncharacterized protein n=1 Tax=Brassica napus TaxID=3708 RepID=A0ABQ7ZP36_BRANA|nr:hypothetical protein HID58_058110 [Brassica napus]
MGSLKSLVILALLFSLSLAVFADTSNDASTPKDEVKPSEATDAIGQHQPQAAEAETEANDVVVEPQQRVRCGCINGCCGICPTVVPDHNPRRPWKPKLLMPTLLNLSKGAVVAVDTDVAESAIMDGAATVAHVLKRRLKLLSPNNVADVGTVAAEATLMGSAVLVVPRRWLLKKRRKRKKLSHEWLKSLVILALLFSLSFAVFADSSKDASTHAKDEVKPSEATDAQAAEAVAKDVVAEPQQGWRGGCRYGCCGGWFFGRCNYCCRSPQAEETVETEAVEANVVEPQQGGRGGCRYGCCGSWRYGRCSYCCRSPQAETVETEAVDANVVEPQQGGRGGCRYGCCGSWRYGRCSYCCRSPQTETVETEAVDANVVEPQQGGRGGCRYGCCGSWRYGRCSYCCRGAQAESEGQKKEEAKP